MPVVGDGSTCGTRQRATPDESSAVQVKRDGLNSSKHRAHAHRHDGQEQRALQGHVGVKVSGLQLLQGQGAGLYACC